MSQITLVIAPDTTILLANRVFNAWAGIVPDQWAGQRVRTFMGDEFASQLEDLVGRMEHGEDAITLDWPVPPSNPVKRWARLVHYATRNDQEAIAEIMIVGTDVTALKRAELATTSDQPAPETSPTLTFLRPRERAQLVACLQLWLITVDSSDLDSPADIGLSLPDGHPPLTVRQAARLAKRLEHDVDHKRVAESFRTLTNTICGCSVPDPACALDKVKKCIADLIPTLAE